METDNNELLNKFIEYLLINRYSYATVNIYKHYINDCLTHFNKPVNEIELEEIINYIKKNIIDFHKSNYDKERYLNAFSLFFKSVLHADLIIDKYDNKFYETKLPLFLSMENIKKIILSTSNIKHKTILSLMYFLGLKLEELINIKLTDIDFKKSEIIIRNARRNTERIIYISKNLNKQIIEYNKTYMPKDWLFEGRKNNKYCCRNIQLLIKNCINKCNIKENVSPSIIRHSIAAHLFQNGTDLHLIQDYLGISSAKYAKKYAEAVNIHKANLLKHIEDDFIEIN